jgi:phosphate-selective porin OprO/OprP
VSHGDTVGTTSSPGLPSYRSSGNQTFFSYRSDGTVAGTVVADGRRTRFIPQAWLYRGPFGLLVEYTAERQALRRGEITGDIDLQGLTINSSWVLTGESNSFRGVDPRRPWGSGGHGAVVLGARYSRLSIDDAVFPVFSDPTRSASAADLYSLVVSWNLVRNVRWMLDANLVEFERGGSGGVDRPDEKTVLTRFQVSF